MSLPDGMTPRLLLVEDDPISREFLAAALSALPAAVETAADCAEATRLSTRFDLWLIDANLPDGDGIGLLHRLRTASPGTVALAHTADPSPLLRETLLRAGFADVLVKPLTADSLRRIVGAALGCGMDDTPPATASAATALPDWDEDTALKALGGQREHVLQLRSLFLAELPSARRACTSAFDTGDQTRLRDALHKLRASCGFVGAARLADAVARWQAAPTSALLRDEFNAAADALQPR
ncbi:response regulator [Pseudoxanthomonas putridarboris]|uniref:Response regulator n=1 Tax=Pseudoxanthomonas putridarboris TaxID=752605 RepID=A0ABU9J0Y6_9GAMM